MISAVDNISEYWMNPKVWAAIDCTMIGWNTMASIHAYDEGNTVAMGITIMFVILFTFLAKHKMSQLEVKGR